MTAPAGDSGAAAMPGSTTAHAVGHAGVELVTVRARSAAPPVRIAAAGRAVTPTAARPAPHPVAEADPHTRPLVLPPPPFQPPPVTGHHGPPPKRTWSRHVREYLRRLNPVQVLCWQVAAFAVVLSVRQPWPVLIAIAAAAVVLLALTAVRSGGRWLYELVGLAAGFLTRTRRQDLPKTGGPAGTTVALLGMLLPGSTIRTLETSQGQAMAISHGGGLTAQLRPAALTPELLATLPMPAALLPTVSDAGHQLFGVQLVLHAGLRAQTPRRLLVAVHAARTVETPVDAQLTLTLRNALRRVRRALDRAGVAAQPLAEEQALSAIAGLAHVTGGRTEVREDWRFWRTGPVNQATFGLTGWAALTDTQARGLISALLAGVPGVAVTVTLAASTQRRGEPIGSATIRLAGTTEAAVDAAAGAIAHRVTPRGIRLARLDGTQLTGVAVSLPIGVFLP
ncbi:type VII secretion protein EccE [Actinophytocola sediminis]